MLSIFAGILLGSGLQVLFSDHPIYPKWIAATFVLVGIVMITKALLTTSI